MKDIVNYKWRLIEGYYVLGVKTSKNKVKNSENGQLKEEIEYANTDVITWRTVYNKKGPRVEETIYNNPDGKVYCQNVSVFDKDGMLIEYIMLDELTGGEKRHYKYTFEEFDKNGNWIKRKTQFYYDKGGKLELSSTSMTYREITYF